MTLYPVGDVVECELCQRSVLVDEAQLVPGDPPGWVCDECLDEEDDSDWYDDYDDYDAYGRGEVWP